MASRSLGARIRQVVWVSLPLVRSLPPAFAALTRCRLQGAPPDSKAERKLLFKMDWYRAVSRSTSSTRLLTRSARTRFILSFICLMYWSNYLDRANLANAYVSGMKEALNMVGNDLNKFAFAAFCP